MINDTERKLRVWLCMLYEDNTKHLNSLETLKKSCFDYCYIRHIEKKDEFGNILKKAHFHTIIWFGYGVNIQYALKQLNLDDEDIHLFCSYTDFKMKNGQRKFKSLNNYIDYLTHIGNDDKPDKYTFEDFVTNIPDRIKIAITGNLDKSGQLLSLINFIEEYKKNHGYKNFREWFEICYENGYGDVFYSNWNKIKDLLNGTLNF